jgi:hypothetical protein
MRFGLQGFIAGRRVLLANPAANKWCFSSSPRPLKSRAFERADDAGRARLICEIRAQKQWRGCAGKSMLGFERRMTSVTRLVQL